MTFLTTFELFVTTAIAEIIGCYLPYLWLRHGNTLASITGRRKLGAFLLAPDTHPAASGRVYAAYGGVFATVALVWLWTESVPTAVIMECQSSCCDLTNDPPLIPEVGSPRQ